MKYPPLILALVVLVAACATDSLPQTREQSTDKTFPAWTRDAGARTAPRTKRTCSANSFGAKPNADVKSTDAIQKAIDKCANSGGGVVSFDKGEYVTGALFLKNN